MSTILESCSNRTLAQYIADGVEPRVLQVLQKPQTQLMGHAHPSKALRWIVALAQAALHPAPTGP